MATSSTPPGGRWYPEQLAFLALFATMLLVELAALVALLIQAYRHGWFPFG